MNVLIFVEIDNGLVKKSSQEAVAYGAALAQKTNGKATALVIGQTSDNLAALGNYGASKVLHANDSTLTQVNTMAYASVLASAANSADVVVMAKSSLGDALAARTAGKLRAGLVSNVTELPDTSAGFKVKRSIYTGKAFAITEMNTEKKVLTVKKNAINPVPTEALAEVTTFTAATNPSDFTAKVISTEKATGELSLTEADLVVSGGRGLKGPENWQPLLDFARAIGAATGCSKPVSDLDWRPHHEHIGQTGIKVAPNVYFAFGISGAIQHLAGVNSSKVIVVVNKDPEAPFFKAADYGIVGDVFDVLPRLTKAIQNA